MGKITIMLSEEIEESLRKYVSKKYPTETYGKISLTIEEALKEYLPKKTM